VYLAFDLLHLDGRSTRELPYVRRRELLFDLALDDGRSWRTPRHFVTDKERVLAATRDRGLEGVVAKRLGSPYLPGARSGAWVKHKHRRTEPFLVTGWSPRKRRRPESLLLARVGSDGSLEPAGSVPLVLGDGQADEIRRRLEALVLPPTRRGPRIRRLGRRYGPRSRSTARPAGPCATCGSAPLPRSNRRARRRSVQDPWCSAVAGTGNALAQPPQPDRATELAEGLGGRLVAGRVG
jgi:hypothetical protein